MLLGVACAGLLYLVLSALFSAHSARARVMRFFPPRSYGSHCHLHRPYPGEFGHCELLHQRIVAIIAIRNHCSLPQYLGARHGKKSSPSLGWCGGKLRRRGAAVGEADFSGVA